MRHLLLYDSDCGPCALFREVVSLLDSGKRLDFMGLLEADRRGLLNSVPASRRHRSFHLLSPGGRLVSGSSALPELVSLFPAGGIPSRMIEFNPLLRSVTNFLYSSFARSHDSGACAHGRVGQSSTSISTSSRARAGTPGPTFTSLVGAR